MSSSSREKVRPSVIYKMEQTMLFQRTVKYHEMCLKEMFREHYQLTSSGDKNMEWASNLSDKTLEKFRVHLSWVMGLNVFEWDRQNIGNQILETFKKQSALECIHHHIKMNMLSVDYDYILSWIYVDIHTYIHTYCFLMN